MAARTKFGNLTKHAGWNLRGEQQRCVKCLRPIVWGQRCETCKRELRRRQARKPR
jgi:hypothetical protein